MAAMEPPTWPAAGPGVPRRARAAVGAAVVVLSGLLAALGAGVGPAAGTPLPGAPNCPMFPADNIWNTDISNLPVDVHSAAWLASMDASTTDLHPDFGASGDPANPYGMPYIVVPPTHPLVDIAFDYADESDPGPYPFGPETPIEGGQGSTGDRHAIMVNPATCTLYELYDASYAPGTSTAGSGAIWNLNSDALRPAGWTSADAAGLPILPGLLRYDEVQSGQVTHAIRMTAQLTDTSYLWPARHEAGSSANPAYPPMGARFRLKASFDISGYSAQAQVVLRAMQRYGLILADNGTNWYFGGTADNTWPASLIADLKTVPASAFEAVDESSLMVDPNSGQAAQPGVVNGPEPGYRLVAADGGVFDFGSAAFYGSTGSSDLARPIVGLADTADDAGYWMVAADGGIFAFGDAPFYGSMGGRPLDSPIVGMAATPDGLGYWLVAADGGIFAFGDAAFFGSMGGQPLNSPIVAMGTHGGGGYWLVAADGGVFAFGDAPFYGSTGSLRLNRPIVAARALPDASGYWLVAADGGIFAFGGAAFVGSTANSLLNAPIVAMG